MRIGTAIVVLGIAAMVSYNGSLASALTVRPTPTAVYPLLFVVDAQRGAGIFQGRCSVCHTVQAGGPNKLGPALHGLFGRRAGTLPGYNYSPAMRASGIVWSAETLEAYLANPHKDIPGDKMPFPGLPDKADRDDVISYLEQVTR